MSRSLRAALAFAAALLAQLPAADLTAVRAQAVTRQSTPSGLPFRHVHMPDAAFQAVYFAWRDGTTVAQPGKETTATLGASLIMEGPRGSSRSVMIEDFRDLQATVNLSATVSLTQGNLTAPRAKFAAAARLVGRGLADPALPPDRLAEFTKNAQVAIRQSEGNAETVAQRLFSRLVIADGPHRRFLTSDASIYGQVTLADIGAWRRNVLVRAGLTVVAVGPMDAAEIGREIDGMFAGLPQSGTPPVPAKPVLRAPGKLVVLERPAVVQTAMVAGGPMNVAVTPELLRTQLGVSVLGGGTSSRLWITVREKLGAAYGISAALQAVDLDTRVLAIRAAVANDKATGVIAAVREEYARILADGPTDAELDPLKRVYLTGHRDRLHRAPALAAVLLTQALHDYPDDYLATFEQRLQGYGRASVEAAVREALPKLPLTIAVVAPSAAGFAADCVIKAPEEIARCD